MTERIHLPQQVTEEMRAEADRLMAGIDAATQALQAFDAPTCGTRYDLFPGDTPSDYEHESEMPLALVCPWCGQDITTDSLFDMELAWRHTYANEIDSDDEAVSFDYDGDGDFDSIVLVHEQCNKPVELPGEWGVKSL